ncbi:tyrosine--tRNA ligase, mitochondrial isoform X2 [Rhodnius prolixus]|uniref:tyrosine--tRNA ligase, mitochondrial isoform X2 n=1 Tax=Rhodnius prolixus TaxID=13249 RepID=UPI003D187D76
MLQKRLLVHFPFLARYISSRNVMGLQERGMYHDIFPSTSVQEVVDLCNAGPQCVYAGFDPTASSLHLGNLLVVINLLHWQRGGHHAIALLGGATGRIGDPSGRSKERDEQQKDVIKQNIHSLNKNLTRLFENHQQYFMSGKTLNPIRIIDNLTWYENKNAVDFISSIGRHFRMGTMLSRTSVESRLQSEAGMSYTEFSYQVFQAFDWLHLFKNYNCRFQVGGSDQMGNIMSGYDLISKVLGKAVYGLTLPLIKSEAGDKFGKTAGNAVWLDANMTSCFDFYQYFIRIPDAQVEQLLKLLTFMKLGEITDLMNRHMAKPEERRAQKHLADQITLLVHGEEGLADARQTTSAMYDSDLKVLCSLTTSQISSIFKGAPIVEILLRPGINVRQMALAAKCFPTETDAERIINAGGFYVNHNKTRNPEEILVNGVHILPNDISLLRVGKKNYWIVKWLK